MFFPYSFLCCNKILSFFRVVTTFWTLTHVVGVPGTFKYSQSFPWPTHACCLRSLPFHVLPKPSFAYPWMLLMFLSLSSIAKAFLCLLIHVAKRRPRFPPNTVSIDWPSHLVEIKVYRIVTTFITGHVVRTSHVRTKFLCLFHLLVQKRSFALSMFIWNRIVILKAWTKVKWYIYIAPFLAAASKRSMCGGTHFTDPERMESRVNFSGKEGQPNIQRSTRPGVEPGISGLGGRDLTTAPTLPLEQYIPTENLGEDGTPIHCRLLSLADDWYSSFTQLRELVQCSKVFSLLKDVWGLVSKSRPLDCEADTMTSAPPQTLMYQLVM